MGSIVKKEEKKRKGLEQKVVEARQRDQQDLQEWQVRTVLAEKGFGGGSPGICGVQDGSSLDDIVDLGSNLVLMMDTDRVEVVFQAKSREVIPDTEKRLTVKGNVSTKQMTLTMRNHIYQEYVCSCVLRISRELFALLPVDEVLIHVEGELWIKGGGQKPPETILSVRITRSELAQTHIESLDGSDCITSFPHQMKFLETRGFQSVGRLGFNE